MKQFRRKLLFSFLKSISTSTCIRFLYSYTSCWNKLETYFAMLNLHWIQICIVSYTIWQ